MNIFITGLRFDLAAKLLYANSRLENYQIQWYTDLYKQHILVFNGGQEFGSDKVTVEQFITAFNDLIDNFDPHLAGLVPVGNNNIIINAAHRTCLGFLKGIELPVDRKNHPGTIYDYNFFVSRYSFQVANNNIHPKLDKIYSDEMALEFCRRCPNLRMLTIFPAAVGAEKLQSALDLIKRGADIIYAVKISATRKFLDNLIKEFYRGEAWVGGFLSSGSGAKTLCCWNSQNPFIHAFLIAPRIDCVQLKRSIRNLYEIANHSVHINDTHQETVRIASSLFNANSLHYLENAAIKLNAMSQQMLLDYQRAISHAPNDYCIVSSFVLDVYGLRQAKDIDYLYHTSALSGMDSHNKYAKLYPVSITDIIYNPKYHFYFNGLKFCSLYVLNCMKEARHEDPKDIIDLQLLKPYLEGSVDSTVFLTHQSL